LPEQISSSGNGNREPIVHPDGSTIVASDLNSLDGKNAIVEFTAPVAGTYEIRILATSGLGEYAFEAFKANAVDLHGTAFNAVSDHIPDGQTDVTYTVSNTGNVTAGAFDTHVVWSVNNIVGDADDVIVPGSQESFPAGLASGTSVSGGVSLQLDSAHEKRVLFVMNNTLLIAIRNVRLAMPAVTFSKRVPAVAYR